MCARSSGGHTGHAGGVFPLCHSFGFTVILPTSLALSLECYAAGQAGVFDVERCVQGLPTTRTIYTEPLRGPRDLLLRSFAAKQQGEEKGQGGELWGLEI